ncbi:hypothetical protein CUU66_15290 [Peribacillus deserti]|uniref:Uncharacterized protein n=1 Tax=Peribacillus deserti TaxID=673318 RepID=A0A2N5M3W0_9BACI|nr:hypothetical protein CUU66_15290 [Peribacillus deserti]
MCEPGGATGRGHSSVVRATKLLSSLSLANQQVFFIRFCFSFSVLPLIKKIIILLLDGSFLEKTVLRFSIR